MNMQAEPLQVHNTAVNQLQVGPFPTRVTPSHIHLQSVFVC